jgi:hypothetical protein
MMILKLEMKFADYIKERVQLLQDIELRIQNQ